MELKFKNNSIGEIKKSFCKELGALYDSREAENIFLLIAEFYLGLSMFDCMIDKDRRLSESEILHFEKALIRLKQNEPIQYIMGEVEFLDCTINVNPSVLIPRPETEELVDLILRENDQQKSLNILDIGTGSGCIPIALKDGWPNAIVSATDVSEEALSLAKANAERNKQEVNFELDDILNSKLEGEFDIIVSNPPYIEQSRREKLETRVVEKEPNLALFVPDDNPLVFYKAIKNLADSHLKENGLMYFEINEEFSEETASLFQMPGYSAKILKDINGLTRFLRISKKN